MIQSALRCKKQCLKYNYISTKPHTCSFKCVVLSIGIFILRKDCFWDLCFINITFSISSKRPDKTTLNQTICICFFTCLLEISNNMFSAQWRCVGSHLLFLSRVKKSVWSIEVKTMSGLNKQKNTNS